MLLEKFADLVSLSKKRCNVSNSILFDDIFKNAINEAYQEIVKVEKYLSYTYVPIIDGTVTLPDDALSIEKYEPELLEGDYIKGNTLFTSLTEPTLKVFYVAVPEVLVNDSDVPSVNLKWFYPMTSYACYAYYLFKKKQDMVSMYFVEWDKALKDLTTKESVKKNREIKNEYADFGY